MTGLEITGAIVAIIAAWYVDVRYVRQWKRCPACKGSGRGPLSNSRTFGYCRRCQGEKVVRRFGSPRP